MNNFIEKVSEKSDTPHYTTLRMGHKWLKRKERESRVYLEKVLQGPCVTVTQENWDSSTGENEWKVNGVIICGGRHNISMRMGQQWLKRKY